ncbi:class I adenylate-forming enzyme family protein [Amycolatopsis jiangsuensis]|uniref:Acyl-coenzyme A synthetase/AMP-(Fatty) acid ligase n=1 Tax=Amycolatopsis jiangsuensis TaxID=1181879 RepID=A0A840IVF3_9PSEU|nr:fatty acid--CoA ligase family protein [Amycolatopsis jiangsuensis]MBB4685118.1 acyl-coenzyme A synthetase/AMP-(fatty) acid ligase [Amycolatopsis jiangsuensis]
MGYPQALLDALRREPGAVAFEHGPRRVTRGEVLELVGRLTAGLRAAGVRPGDGVGLATAVTPEGWAAQLAVQTLGCRAVGVRAGLPPEHLQAVLDGVAAVVVDEASESTRLRAATSATMLRIGPELLAAYEEPVPQGTPGELGWVVFTSGSTGVPKGVAFDFGALAALGVEHRGQPETELAEEYRRFLLFGTLTSAVMVMHLQACLLAGGTVVIPEALPDFPWILPRLDVTAALVTVPRLYRILDVLREENVDLSGLRMLTVAGSPVEPRLLAEAFDRIGPALRQGYGQTETGKLTVLSAADVIAYPPALASVGLPCEGVEVQIRDAAGTVLPAGASGEVFVRTSTAFAGYWRDPAQTSAVRSAGWVRTQDVGQLDERGFLHLTGRSRDVVIVNAVIHYTGPIERALASHEDVDQAYVVAAPDERTGEAAHAFVVAAPGRAPDPDRLRATVAAELGEAAVPATFTVIGEVPVTAAGKPDKTALLALR